MAKDSEITVISVGPGAYDMITLRAIRAINEQDILIAGKETINTFGFDRPFFIPNKIITGTVEYIKICEEKKVGVLATGDAGFFSIARAVCAEFENVKVIPGVSSVNAGFALLKKDWSGYRFLSIHGRTPLTEEITQSSVILCDSENTPDKFIEKHPYIKGRFNLYILKDISLPTEAVYTEPQGTYDSTRLILVLEEKK